uniref:Protein YIF1 n=1 Tax=Panagrolaimus superbus TaxID=310955 RepID=A0A914YCY6_9BILA
MTEPDWNWGDTSNNQKQQGQWNNFNNQNWNQQQQPPSAPQEAWGGGGVTPQPPNNPNFYNQWNASPPPSHIPAAATTPPVPHHRQPQPPTFNNPPANAFGATPNASFNGFDTQQFNPMFNVAQQIGGQFAEQQKEKLSQVISSFNLKYYFAVDTNYVGKKIGILLFPFVHREWACSLNGDNKPVPAKMDINAPDLYVPLMAFITYILLTGFVFGVQQRFSPEQLGMQTTNALFYLFLENMIVLITKYVLNISHTLSLWHTLAFTGYKFWARSLKSFVLDMQGGYNIDEGRKRKVYLLLSLVITQALIMYLLTSSVTSFMSDNYDFAKMALSKMGMKSNKVPMTADGDVDYEALLKMPK